MGENGHFPVIHAMKNQVLPGEENMLFWDIPGAKECELWVQKPEEQKFQHLAYPSGNGTLTLSFGENDLGNWLYSMMVLYEDGVWAQTNVICIEVVNEKQEEKRIEQLKLKGMTNVWNIVFMVYRTVHIGDYHRSFTDKEMDVILRMSRELKPTIEDLSGGLMRIGTVEVLVEEKPVTSASGSATPPNLVYGPEGDVDFSDVLDNRDVNLVAVFAPLSGLTEKGEWAGLGGTYMEHKGRRVYTVILNCVNATEETYNIFGDLYPLDITGLVHEMLHAVETNSRDNGYSDFEGVHEHKNNGYDYPGDDCLVWYYDLMRDILKSKKNGFHPISYYVTHNLPGNQ